MTKKDYILKLLTMLEGTRELAKPLQDLVQHTDVDNEFIDGLSAMMIEAVHEVADTSQQAKLQASQNFLKSLQSKEIDESISADAELDEMLAKI
jgi:hypothetical protein